MNCCRDAAAAVDVCVGNSGVLGKGVVVEVRGGRLGGAVAVPVWSGVTGVAVIPGFGPGKVQNVRSSEQQLKSRYSLFMERTSFRCLNWERPLYSI